MTRRRIGQGLLVIGLVAMILGAWAGAQFRTATARRLFFVDPFGMAWSPEGRVYVGVDRREVHGYTPEGQPVTAWTIAQDAGRFRLRTLESGEVEVAVEASGERLRYAPDGTELERQSDATSFERFGSTRDDRVEADSGEVYLLEEVGLVRIRGDQRTVIVPAPPPPLSWLGSRPVQPLAALLFAGTIGLLVGAVMTAAGPRSE